MKKIMLVAMMAVMTLTASAQLITSNRTVRGERAHNLWLDFGGGFGTEDGAKGADLNLGLRFNKMFHENVGWDILRVSARTNTEDIDGAICAEALTGVRGESPVLFGNSKAYVNVAVGFIYNFDVSKEGFAYEIGAGLKLTRRFNIGIAYNGYKISSTSSGIVGLRLGLAL